MTINSSKIEMYLNIADKFTEMNNYQESETYAEKCRKMARQTEVELKRQSFEKAQRKMNKARLAIEYKVAAEEFEKAKGYLNAEDLVVQCLEISEKLEHKSIKKSLVQKTSILAGILLLIVLSILPISRYYTANVFGLIKAYPAAVKIYDKLGDYKASKEKLKESQYMIGIKLMKDEDYTGAVKAFLAAEDYKDSEEKKVSMIKIILQNKNPGETVMIAGYNWILLKKSEDEALLIKKVALEKRAYNTETANVTWETSSLREFLNSDFLTENFTESERNNLIHAKINNSSAMYATDGGNDTLDYIFLLSTTEAKEYQELLKGFKNNSWLRSSGYTQNSAAFLSAGGKVMDYGYMVSSEEFTLHPVLLFNLK